MLYTLYLMLFCHFFLFKGYFLHQIQSKTGLERSTIEMTKKEMYRNEYLKHLMPWFGIP
jgi:hypothetical protein